MPALNIQWNEEKAAALREQYGVSFDDVVPLIENAAWIDDVPHHNQERYPGQRIYVVELTGYAYLVPYMPYPGGIFLKTLYPSRKAKRDYLE